MIITNNSRKQALAVFNRITSKFSGFIYTGNDIADNGQISVYVRENNDVVYSSNFFNDSTLEAKLTKSMLERTLTGEAEDNRDYAYKNDMLENPMAYSNI